MDAAEAEEAGRAACRAVLAGETGQMVAFRRLSSAPYRCETFLVPIEEVMLGERVLPAEYLAAGGTDVTEAFCGWCRPCWGRSCRPWRGCSEPAVPNEPGRSVCSGRVFDAAVPGKYDKTSYFSKPAGFVY